jgi:putative peptide zinc metalloprotease protein
MNLSEALDAALPEIPRARLTRSRPPQLDPDLIVREDVLDGEPIVGVMQRDKANYFRFDRSQWQLASLFDGVRSYDEIATLFTESTGVGITPEIVRGFAQSMDESGFWYQTPQEKNIALSEKLMAQRNRRANRKQKINLAHISFSAWDPDQYLGWLDRKVGWFIYNPWSVTVLVGLLLFQAAVFITKWSTMGPDILLYYNFAHKSLYDLAEFWVLFLLLGFFHETAHGLTCKHFGGEVHSMGLMFLYLTPCFFVDVTEGWISASRLQRLATIIAGIWVEMTLCSLAMIVWLNTQPGERLHDFAYEIILLTGIAVVLINLNPLIKLDGYYFLTESIGIPDLKERSTAFLSGWVQGRILGLPVEVPAIPRRRLPLFVLYAFASGLYSYVLLFAVIRLTYNVASNWLAEFALLPAGFLAFGLFRGRLNSLRNVVVRYWELQFSNGFRVSPKGAALAALVLILLFVPLLRDRENAYFVVEPSRTASLHATVPGRVEEVLVAEGQAVHAGQPVLRMTSASADALRSTAEAQRSAAQYQSFHAQVRKESIGVASSAEEAARRAESLAQSTQASLDLTAPADGIVLSEDPSELVDQSVAAGEPLLEVAESGPRVARVFVPASSLKRVQSAAPVSLAPNGSFSVIRTRLTPLDGEAVVLPTGLVPHQDYKGIVLPSFYCARIELPASAAALPLGTSGKAVIFGPKRSLFERGVLMVADLVHAHVW